MALSPEVAAREMARVAETIEALTRIPSQQSAAAAKRLYKVLVDQYLRQCDPYGKPWKKLAPSTVKAKGHAVIGIGKNRAMLPRMQVAPMSGAGVGVTFGADYAAYFNRRRALLPVGDNIPPTWRAAIEGPLNEAATAAGRAAGGQGSIDG